MLSANHLTITAMTGRAACQSFVCGSDMEWWFRRGPAVRRCAL